MLAFGTLTCLLLAGLKRWSERRRERAIPLAAAAAEAIVISGFDGSPPERGRVRWQGQSWAAVCLESGGSLRPGAPVTVMGREGNRLQVMVRGLEQSGGSDDDRTAAP